MRANGNVKVSGATVRRVNGAATKNKFASISLTTPRHRVKTPTFSRKTQFPRPCGLLFDPSCESLSSPCTVHEWVSGKPRVHQSKFAQCRSDRFQISNNHADAGDEEEGTCGDVNREALKEESQQGKETDNREDESG
jgi:hypothetical protein